MNKGDIRNTAVPAPGRTRVNDPAGMRRRVLDVAADAFQAHGYQATGMGDILHAAAVSGGAMYHHFPSKKALGLAVIRERVAQEIGATWSDAVGSASDVRAGIRRVFRSVIRQLDARGAVQGCPLNNLTLELSLTDADFRLAVQEIFQSWRGAIAHKIHADHALGLNRQLDPEGFAIFVVALFSGAMALAKAEQGTTALRACLRQFQRIG